MTSPRAPCELQVNVHELSGLKHDGHHSVRLTLRTYIRQSAFIDGYGSWKPIEFSTRFKAMPSPSLSDPESRTLLVSVIHQRLIEEDKVVGDCAIPLAPFPSGAISGWFPLVYKGSPRGMVKLSITATTISSPAASATVPIDPEIRKRILLERKARKIEVSNDWPK